ncbi:ABC transporter ATP-binding protein [Engelhardtia mirabilis]|uniref:Putative ABC transporter ATP-binding protein YbhF n=1 Tax=Engelhardtia mirabilis TaxID=2528011 RepID=A0A518BI28_9BACT|nr:putative ABC transporter ATP-binding protein YbhF [Planctomycetes bacterium Pla133]QDV00965.1 putative ABC transporter ATP-binding protein YbhF [Planctomycetes bacterium Pla86]
MIEVEHVTKRYGSALAVDDVSFRLGAGEVVGFLGPNGAGKSTVLKMISTWLPPTSGSLRVAGFDVEREALEARRELGYLPEHNALYDTMRVFDFLRFMGKARGLFGPRLAERLDWVVASCSLQDVLRQRVNQCSKGYRQRIGLAASLIHDPRVLLLDEPTHGLDPLQVVAFRDFIHELAPGRAILFSSHILSEVAAICERILVINRGRLLADAKLDDLRAQAAERGIDLERLVLEIVEERSGGREAALRGGARPGGGAA